MFFYPVIVNECAKVIDNLKWTKTGFNQLPVKLYKYLKNIISRVITSIANRCFPNGIFRVKFESAIVTEKKLSKYRPNTNLPVISKIIENFIHSRLHEFIFKFQFN